MKILLSNDDGYTAPGLRCLFTYLQSIGEVTVVAPDRNRSGASSSLTLTQPIRVNQVESHIYAVEGTPTDCVHLAMTGLLDFEPDIVVSGINESANLGDDVLYSGTVAAALEGRFLGLPAIAVSLVDGCSGHFETAAQATVSLVKRLQQVSLNSDTILNINVPDVPHQQLLGFQSTRLGNRHKAEKTIKSVDPRGKPIYWIGSAGPEQDAGPGTDFFAVKAGYVSVTPIQVDITRHSFLNELSDWLVDL